MPVDWNSTPPALQVEKSSIQDYRLAANGQRFFGILDLTDQTIYIVPSQPIVEKKGGWWGTVRPSFTRVVKDTENSPLRASHVMTLALLRINPVKIARRELAGFSAKKVNDVDIEISFRSGLNVSFQNGSPDFGDDAGRIMPALWADAITTAFELAFGIQS